MILSLPVWGLGGPSWLARMGPLVDAQCVLDKCDKSRLSSSEKDMMMPLEIESGKI